MRTDKEIEYLIKAIDAFQRRLIVISPDFEILAANVPLDELAKSDPEAITCHKRFHNLDTPCANCAVNAVKKSQAPSLCPKPGSLVVDGRMACFLCLPHHEWR